MSFFANTGVDPASNYTKDAFYNNDCKNNNKIHKIESDITIEQLTEFDMSQTVFVSGAGPAGLMAALTWKRERPHLNIVVLEHRDFFSRRNIATIKTCAYPYLKKVGLLQEVTDKTFHIENMTFALAKGEECAINYDGLIPSEIVTVEDCDENFNYDDIMNNEDKEYFLNDGRGIRIADYQQIIYSKCKEVGVVFLTKNMVHVKYNENTDTTSLTLYNKETSSSINTGSGESIASYNSDDALDAEKTLSVFENPYFVVIAEGAQSKNVKNLVDGWDLHDNEEVWVVANRRCTDIDKGFMGIMGPDDTNPGRAIIGIFDPANEEVALTERFIIEHNDTDNYNAHELTTRDTLRMAKWFGFESAEFKWNSSFFKCCNKTAKKMTVGSRIALVGDSAGTASPVAGMGVSISTTAHGYAMMKLIQSLEEPNCNNASDHEEALDLYSKRIASFVRRWHNNTATIWSVAGGELGKVKFPENPKEAAKKVAQSATDNKINVKI
eukprot:Pgem_evm1s7094